MGSLPEHVDFTSQEAKDFIKYVKTIKPIDNIRESKHPHDLFLWYIEVGNHVKLDYDFYNNLKRGAVFQPSCFIIAPSTKFDKWLLEQFEGIYFAINLEEWESPNSLILHLEHSDDWFGLKDFILNIK